LGRAGNFGGKLLIENRIPGKRKAIRTERPVLRIEVQVH
jgi:hypothetical protein